MSHQLTVVTPVKGYLDIERLKRVQLFLFDLHKTTHEIIIIYAPSEKEHVASCKEEYPRLRITLIPEQDIFQRPNTVNKVGWRYQQLLKLHVAHVVSTPWFLLMDADCFPCRPLKDDDLIVDGKCACSMISWDVSPEHWRKDVSKIIPFGQSDRLLGVTPQILHTPVVTDMLREHGSTITNVKFTEFFLYWAYLRKHQLDILAERSSFSNSIWTREGRRLFEGKLHDALEERLADILGNYQFGLVQSRSCATADDLETLVRIIHDRTCPSE